MEVVIVIAVVAILASAFSSVMIPMMNFYFYYPQSSRVNNAGADVLDAIIEGDGKLTAGLISGTNDPVRGLRFAGPPCNIPTSGTGGDTITAASADSITYQYANADSCGTNTTGRISHTVVLSYDSVNHVVTQSVDGAAATVIPYYASSASEIKIDPPAGNNFFRYFDAAGTDLGATPLVTNIMRVDITVNATSGTGQVEYAAGQILLKAGVEIKRYTT